MQWNVYRGNFNSRKIETYNIFTYISFLGDCVKNAEKNRNDREAFMDTLRKDLMYYFWSKCEWEVIISHWPPSDHLQDEKVDVYSQVMMNWDIFSTYVWLHRDQLKEDYENYNSFVRSK